jgi:acyl dehydratase
MTEIEDITGLQEYVGKEVSVSDWLLITQDRINAFAEATDDHQWIHTDPERSRRESPFKQPIAHGFLTLSLLSELMKRAVSIGRVRMGINYGLNRVRFISPVPAGSRVRGRFALEAFDEINGGAQCTWKVTVEREGGEKPCCVSEWLVRYYV